MLQTKAPTTGEMLLTDVDVDPHRCVQRLVFTFDPTNRPIPATSIGWRVGYEPRGQVTHVQGASTQHHPYRMIVRHHRSVHRFATKHWRGARLLLLVPAAVLLTVRAAFAIVARALGPRRSRPQVTH